MQVNAQTLPKAVERHFYKIDLKIDFDNLTYTGVERVRWVNRGEKPTSIIYFHLYPNLRTATSSFQNNGLLRIRRTTDRHSRSARRR